MARPAKSYEEKVKPHLKSIRKWRNEDMSILAIARRLGVTQPFLNEKMKVYPELAQALKPRALTQEEIEKRKANEKMYRRRYLNSTKSFVRRHSTVEEDIEIIEIILKKSSESDKEKIRKQILE